MVVGEILPNSVLSVSVEDKDSRNTSCTRQEIDIPERMREALKKWDSDFVLWRSTEYSPYLCLNISTSPALALNAGLGDFNGDGLQDVVVAGHNDRSELLVVVLSQKNAGYKVFPLCSGGIHSTSEQVAYGCSILGLTSTMNELGQFPKAAIYTREFDNSVGIPYSIPLSALCFGFCGNGLFYGFAAGDKNGQDSRVDA